MEITRPREEVFDLAIVGGGPAGTAAALEACRRGLRVVIWERDRFPRDKVCGEFLSAESVPVLEQEIPADLARGAVIERAEFVSRHGRGYAFALPRRGRGLSRRVLDHALWKAAAASGAEAREGVTVRRVYPIDPGCGHGARWGVVSSQGSTLMARALLVACGRWWTLEGFPSPARQENKTGFGPLLGVKAHFRGVPLSDAVEMYYFPGGYCGLAPVEDGLYNACCLVHRGLARDATAGSLSDFAAWLKSVARQPALEARLRGADQCSETVATAPFRPGRRRAECDGALVAGDAAGVIDPFTGDGISMALHSGRLAAEEAARILRANGGVYAIRELATNYARRHAAAVRRSYFIAGLLRGLVRAPARLQASAMATLPWLGVRLLAETRWRSPV